MAILEALSLGTPVLVAPSCGIANDLRKFEDRFVPVTDDLKDLVDHVNYWIENVPSFTFQQSISDFCRQKFGIKNTCELISGIYERELRDISGN
jgi:glycosyltransferase involved in cell wall biosynthesis